MYIPAPKGRQHLKLCRRFAACLVPENFPRADALGYRSHAASRRWAIPRTAVLWIRCFRSTFSSEFRGRTPEFCNSRILGCVLETHPTHRLTACLGLRISFCTLQLFMSATKTTSSDGHASPCGQLNCLGPRPDSPSMPRILPSSVSLYIRPGSLSMANRYCVGPLVVMHSAH